MVVSLLLVGCAPPFEERFEGELSVASDLDLDSVGEVAFIDPHGGGLTPSGLNYFIEGEDVMEKLESALATAGFIQSPVSDLGRQWQRDSEGLLQTVQAEPFAEGDTFTSGTDGDDTTYVSQDKGVQVSL